jgi:hypothetical protein
LPEKRTNVQLPTGPAEAVEVGVSEAVERWTDIKLEDGSSLRIKAVILGALRVEGQYDQDGNPLYMIKANQVMTVSAPDHLRKGSTAVKGVQ